ncbi:MAG TPA: hypothetical protein VF403_19050 [Kofleriaceae bacterium]
MKSLGLVMFLCATAAAAPKLEMVHNAAGSYGAQKAGEDAGPLYAFIRVDSDKADTMTFKDLSVTRDGKTCATMTKLERIASIPEIKDTTKLMRLDADKGTPFKGALAKGTTWLRIDAVMNHQCHEDKVLPVVVVHFTNGKDTVEVTRALIEHLPS